MILAGILALPALLTLVAVFPIVGVLSLPALALLIFRKSDSSTEKATRTTTTGPIHVIITGGSSGIGLSIAQECVKRGVDRVTLLARRSELLKESKSGLEKEGSGSKTKVDVVSVDVTDATALAAVAKDLCVQKDDDVTTYLFCCAGMAHPGTFSELEPKVLANGINVNYLGAIYTVHAFYPYLSKGTIVLTSSAAGQLGIYGLSSYAPAKFALRGFAETLHMELVNRPNIHVQIAFPPDTNTPGFENENKLKPKETHLISESGGLWEPNVVGGQMVKEAMKPKPRFAVYFGLEGWMLATITAGMCPESSLVDAMCQVALTGLLRFVGLFYLNDFWSIILKCDAERTIEAKKDYGSIKEKHG